MKPSDSLDPLLASWQVESASCDREFGAEVWARIRAEPAPKVLGRRLTFPVALPLAAGLSLFIGVAAAVSVNHRQSLNLEAAAYARSIDPLLITAGAAHHHPAS